MTALPWYSTSRTRSNERQSARLSSNLFDIRSRFPMAASRSWIWRWRASLAWRSTGERIHILQVQSKPNAVFKQARRELDGPPWGCLIVISSPALMQRFAWIVSHFVSLFQLLWALGRQLWLMRVLYVSLLSSDHRNLRQLSYFQILCASVSLQMQVRFCRPS